MSHVSAASRGHPRLGVERAHLGQVSAHEGRLSLGNPSGSTTCATPTWPGWSPAGRALTLDVFTVLLDVEPDVLADRIAADEMEAQARRWRLDRIQTYAARRPWMLESADLVVDSTAVPVGEVAGRIVGAVAPLLTATGSACSG